MGMLLLQTSVVHEAMTEDEREHECAALAKQTVDWMVARLGAVKGTGFRGTSDIENELYGWLYEHAMFKDEV